ncbi:MAG: AzlC family ABC transporter permease [Gaiellales bacterium]
MATTSRVEGFWSGFTAMVPLWLGVVPFGFAFAVTARGAGLSLVETQALSLLVFAGSAQFSASGLFGAAASGASIVFTTFLLNVRHVLYGMSLTRTVPLSVGQVPVAGFFLTDEAYGVAVARGARDFRTLLGIELSLYATWNAATLVGAVSAAAIPDPTKLGVDVVFPLAFLALLVPLLHTRVELVVACVSGVVAWLLAQRLSGGLPILATGVAGALVGAWLTRQDPAPTPDELAEQVGDAS